MKIANSYDAYISTKMENEAYKIQPLPKLKIHSTLPTTNQELNIYIEKLLSNDEQSVCDMATD